MKTVSHVIRHLIVVLLAFAGLIFFVSEREQSANASASEEVLSTDQPNAETPSRRGRDPKISARLDEAYGKLPLGFEANQGQSPSQVKFLSRYSGATLFLTADESVLVLGRQGTTKARKQTAPGARKAAAVLRMKMIGANPDARVEGLDQLPGTSNYFKGSDQSRWRANIPNYG